MHPHHPIRSFLSPPLRLPPPQIPFGSESGHPGLYLRWLFYADPVAHAVEALGPMRFADPTRPSTTNHTIEARTHSNMPSVLSAAAHVLAAPHALLRCPPQVPFGAGTRRVNTYSYYTRYFDVDYNTRWKSVGYICTFIGGFQVLHFYITRYKVHVSR